LCRAAQEKGAQLFSNSKVNSLERKGNNWQVQTDFGKINSEWVLFCTNAYSDTTLKGLKQSISPVVSVQAATRPLTDEEHEQILTQNNTLSDNRRVVFYTRKEENRRLVFGSIGVSQYCNGSDQQRLQRG
jgi:glycine/D-amino acid oxidase-like deaminating enzyme